MKNRVLMIGTAIACVVALALPAIASGTGDQKGPRCLDIDQKGVQISVTEEMNNLGVKTGTWNAKFVLYLAGAPCGDATYDAKFIIRTEDSAGAQKDHDFSVTLNAGDFDPAGSGDPQYVWEKLDHKISEGVLDDHEPYEVCHVFSSLTKTGRVADSSPDSEALNPQGLMCSNEKETGSDGARSYGARSYG